MRRAGSRKKRVTLVRDVMGPLVATVSPETSLEEAAEVFASREVLGAPVVDGSGRPVGALTEVDLLLLIRREFSGLPRFRFITWRARVQNLLRFLDRRRPELAARVRTRLRAAKVGEIVERDRPIAGPDDAFGPVGRYMFDTKTTLVPVVEGGRVVGVVGYDAVIRVVYQGLGEATSG